MNEIPETEQPEATTQTFGATGLTCGHCANAVIDELSAIDDVTSVGVEVVKGGESIVTVEALRTVTPDEVAEALAEAGDYHLV